jgi:hypothetical protein
MRKLLFLILVTSMFACSKNKEENKLPRALRNVIKNMDCACDPELTKILLHNKIYYVMGWRSPSPACNRPPVYYDENGHQAIPVALADEAGKELAVVWKCTP